MKDLKISIRIGRKKPKAVHLRIPECWEECPVNIYPFLAQLYLMPAHIMDSAAKSVSALALICGDEWDTLKQLQPHEVYALLPLVDWVFEKLDITVNKVPFISLEPFLLDGKNITWYGPESALNNLRFAEWCAADTFYIEFSKTNDAVSLNKLIAVLYRPAGKGEKFDPESSDYWGDVRERFNDSLLPYRQRMAACIPKQIKLGIYLWFAACRQQIIWQYDEVFPEKKEDEPRSPLEAYGWFGVYDELRGDVRFGGPDRLEDEFIHTVFSSLSRSQIKYREFKREHNL